VFSPDTPKRTGRLTYANSDQLAWPVAFKTNRCGLGCSDQRNGLAVEDALDEQQTAMERETGMTLRHEDLSVVVMRQTPQQQEVLTYVKPSPTS
jgi:hypothetical protein